jgi:hypothetical protein
MKLQVNYLVLFLLSIFLSAFVLPVAQSQALPKHIYTPLSPLLQSKQTLYHTVYNPGKDTNYPKGGHPLVVGNQAKPGDFHPTQALYVFQASITYIFTSMM